MHVPVHSTCAREGRGVRGHVLLHVARIVNRAAGEWRERDTNADWIGTKIVEHMHTVHVRGFTHAS